MEALRSCAGVRSTKGLQVQVWHGSRRGWTRVGRRADPACQQRFPAAAPVTVRWRDEQPERHSVCAAPPRSVASDLRVGELLNRSPPRPNAQNMEELLEKAIYRCRFFTLLGVLGSLVGSVLCFLKGCAYVATSFMEYFKTGGKVMSVLIESIDVYLIGTVMLVFGMGLYELFISNLDIAKISSQRSNFLGLFMLQERPKWLEIQSVNELKTKLGHVIVMALQVGLFDKIQKVAISNPKDLLCFTASILLSSCGLYLLSKLTPNTNKLAQVK
ncbi:hypothetical protein Taro_001713 [Colocasia esculenta]|uniref:Uncharacterized protein n=1 Tax=Colocasia esculenta TaxID=4460 RepID=A0A843TAL7_COLES|nr:hypothetical protein [Colocasia esculenta]